jgi:hypothetical protein
MMKQLLELFLFLPGMIWRTRLRFKRLMDPVHIPQMDQHILEGYVDKLAYQQGENIKLYLKAPEGKVLLQFQQVLGSQRFVDTHQLSIEGKNQKDSQTAATTGCGWLPVLEIPTATIADTPGHYRLKCSSALQEHYITFLISDRSKAKIAVISPTSTWTAYNPYGGQSLYKNFIDDRQVNEVSTQRPNTACEYKDRFSIHDMHIEAGIYHWFEQEYGAVLFPDDALEKGYEAFSDYKLIVFAYHMEYVSSAMYKTVLDLMEKGHSLLFMGANQFYWKVQWDMDHQLLECHKDSKSFSRAGGIGGLWKHQLKREEALMGAAFDERGMGTYAPYQVVDHSHWIYEGTQVKDGDLFGKSGYNGLPICGDETDKMSFWTPSGFKLLAKGLNPAQGTNEPLIWPEVGVNWNSEGGGEIVLLEKSRQGILNTGSIQSGAGLMHDQVFTRMIQNFCKRYAR